MAYEKRKKRMKAIIKDHINGPYTEREMADRLNVSRRTIAKDKVRIKEDLKSSWDKEEAIAVGAEILEIFYNQAKDMHKEAIKARGRGQHYLHLHYMKEKRNILNDLFKKLDKLGLIDTVRDANINVEFNNMKRDLFGWAEKYPEIIELIVKDMDDDPDLPKLEP